MVRKTGRPKCQLCKQEVNIKQPRLCCMCNKVVCPRCASNRLVKRKVYILCKHCKPKFDAENPPELRRRASA